MVYLNKMETSHKNLENRLFIAAILGWKGNIKYPWLPPENTNSPQCQ